MSGRPAFPSVEVMDAGMRTPRLTPLVLATAASQALLVVLAPTMVPIDSVVAADPASAEPR